MAVVTKVALAMITTCVKLKIQSATAVGSPVGRGGCLVAIGLLKALVGWGVIVGEEVLYDGVSVTE